MLPPNNKKKITETNILIKEGNDDEEEMENSSFGIGDVLNVQLEISDFGNICTTYVQYLHITKQFILSIIIDF